MTFTLTFKTPDAVEDAIQDLPEEEQEAAKQVCDAFVEYGEYLRVEVDTKRATCKVLTV